MVRVSPGWTDTVPARDGKKSTIWDIAFKPDGSQLLVAAGNRVLVYDAVDGDLIKTLKGHKDTVYTVDYSADGSHFASGGADRMVIIWTSRGKGKCKYPHNDTIQKVKYNPATHLLASCSAADFGLWSPEVDSVTKYKQGSKILCCDWTIDGSYLILGLFNGSISIRDQSGDEMTTVQRSSPVWSIACCPWQTQNYATRGSTSICPMHRVFAVGCWDGTLSFYDATTGQPVYKERRLGYDPCTVSYFSGGKYLLVGGSDRRVELRTHDGIKISDITNVDGWVWACQARPKHNTIACGTES